MNPNFDAPPSLHLPEPAPTVNSSSYEQAPGWQPPEYGAAPSAAETSSPPLVPSFAVPPAPTGPTGDDPQASSATQPMAQTPTVAADDDLIEKEWVIKAKQIVAGSREDPYQQNRQLAAFKADYMQKRYNKTIKLSE